MTADQTQTVIMAYTDGANCPHHDFKHAAGAAIIQVIQPGRVKIFEWGRYLGSQTNNVAELSGIELAVMFAKHNFPTSNLIIVTDSQYAQGVLTFDVRRECWAYRAKKNRKLVGRIREALPPPCLFELRWVKGHDGDRLNERADQVAKFCKENQRDWQATYWENAGAPPLG